MSAFQWWRSWHGAPTDHKWAVIAARSGVKVGIVSAVAWAMMDYASQHKERGTVDGFDIEELPINEDGRIERCAVCGELGVDNHHWLPHYIAEKVGEDAEKWPQAWLCQKHHDEWHSLLTPNMSGNQKD